jgi:CBS domain-containing protein
MDVLQTKAVVRPDAEMSEVLDKMRGTEDGHLLVVEKDEVVGSISRADLARLAERARAAVGS